MEQRLGCIFCRRVDVDLLGFDVAETRDVLASVLNVFAVEDFVVSS
jgi:hypothetical protein